ncbi:DUF2267 domain-containing protein [Streptomyces sp. HMX87]|uniref:DUF2267 domain-containing protein n=1 Tax=Streptomyces sp. HMX87 TaxID=3390849 RepID=UPI003A842E58
MKYGELVHTVQEQSHSGAREEAERSVSAVLSTLVERLPEGLAHHLVAQLPHELAGLTDAVGSGPEASDGSGQPAGGERFGLTAFAGRVAWRAGIGEEEALRRSAAVPNVLDSFVSPEEMTKVAGALPADIRELLPTTRAMETEV